MATRLPLLQGDVGGQAYYGEYPINFASALGLKEVALLLRRHGASVTDRDSQGNTCLHMASRWPFHPPLETA